MKIAIIGGGNMGGAFARGLLNKKTLSAADLLIVEQDRAKREALKNLGCALYPDITSDIFRYDAVILAVKPQDFLNAALALSPGLLPSQLVISVMAGVALKTLSSALNDHSRLVRAMPNLPAQIGFGITAYIFSSELDPHDLEIASSVLDSVGLSLRVDNEELINAATAISGSGPAYLYYVLESLSAKAETLGFAPDQAKILVEHTFHGGMHLLQQSGKTPQELRRLVTSKGGTTEAALKCLDENKVRESFDLAVQAAFNHAKELSK